jgi:hypothetical protein
MIMLQAQLAQRVEPALRDRAAQDADSFYQALKAETRGAARPVGGGDGFSSTTINQYTDELTVIAPFFSKTTGAGPEIAGAIRSENWSQALTYYHRLVGGLDRWIVDQLKKRPDRAKLAQQAEFLSTMKQELGAIEGKHPTRLMAVFHPDEQYEKEGRIFEVPLALYFWREGGSWHLKDLTNPQRPFEDTADAADGQKEPPRALFEKLDYKVHFPKGRIHYQVPGGSAGEIRTTARTSWHEYLAYIGLGAAAIGLTLATFGTGTVAVAGAWVLAGSGVISAAAAGGDLYERSSHGALDATTAVIDIAQIVAGLTGALALASGRIVVSASGAAARGSPWAGQWARLAVLADRVYVPLIGTRAAADVITVATMSIDAARQMDEIEKGPGTPESKARAKALLLSQLALTGGLTVLSIKGDLPALGRGRQLILQAPKGGGPPVALLSGMEAPTGLKFSQKDVGATTGDGKMTIEQLTESMRTGGWKGDPINIVEMPDGSKISLDNRRLLAAQNAGLKEIPVVYHSPTEKFPAQWAEEGFKLKVNIRRLPSGELVTGGTKGEIVYKKDALPATYGEAALFRTANQGNLKDGSGKFPLWGRHEQPVVRPPRPDAPDGE